MTTDLGPVRATCKKKVGGSNIISMSCITIGASFTRKQNYLMFSDHSLANVLLGIGSRDKSNAPNLHFSRAPDCPIIMLIESLSQLLDLCSMARL